MPIVCYDVDNRYTAYLKNLQGERKVRVAVIGSRTLWIEDLGAWLPPGTTEILSGGACGIDTVARECALSHGLKLTEFLPEYGRYGRAAPLKRNLTIIENAQQVIAFWDGVSKGTKFVIAVCEKKGVPITVHRMEDEHCPPAPQTSLDIHFVFRRAKKRGRTKSPASQGVQLQRVQCRAGAFCVTEPYPGRGRWQSVPGCRCGWAQRWWGSCRW